jgi:hypothetical protein
VGTKEGERLGDKEVHAARALYTRLRSDERYNLEKRERQKEII